MAYFHSTDEWNLKGGFLPQKCSAGNSAQALNENITASNFVEMLRAIFPLKRVLASLGIRTDVFTCGFSSSPEMFLVFSERNLRVTFKTSHRWRCRNAVQNSRLLPVAAAKWRAFVISLLDKGCFFRKFRLGILTPFVLSVSKQILIHKFDRNLRVCYLRRRWKNLVRKFQINCYFCFCNVSLNFDQISSLNYLIWCLHSLLC